MRQLRMQLMEKLSPPQGIQPNFDKFVIICRKCDNHKNRRFLLEASWLDEKSPHAENEPVLCSDIFQVETSSCSCCLINSANKVKRERIWLPNYTVAVVVAIKTWRAGKKWGTEKPLWKPLNARNRTRLRLLAGKFWAGRFNHPNTTQYFASK